MAENEIKELITSNLDNVSDIAISGKDCNFSIQIVSFSIYFLSFANYFLSFSNYFISF